MKYRELTVIELVMAYPSVLQCRVKPGNIVSTCVSCFFKSISLREEKSHF